MLGTMASSSQIDFPRFLPGSGEITVSTTAQPLSATSLAVATVTIKAVKAAGGGANAATVYLGNAAGQKYALAPGDVLTLATTDIAQINLNQFYVKGANATDGLVFVYLTDARAN